jgi:hypothetical protein
LPTKDARRYRMNAVECWSAAGRCEPAYRDLTLAIAEAWLSLACQRVDGRSSRDLDRGPFRRGPALGAASYVARPLAHVATTGRGARHLSWRSLVLTTGWTIRLRLLLL